MSLSLSVLSVSQFARSNFISLCVHVVSSGCMLSKSRCFPDPVRVSRAFFSENPFPFFNATKVHLHKPRIFIVILSAYKKFFQNLRKNGYTDHYLIWIWRQFCVKILNWNLVCEIKFVRLGRQKICMYGISESFVALCFMADIFSILVTRIGFRPQYFFDSGLGRRYTNSSRFW